MIGKTNLLEIVRKAGTITSCIPSIQALQIETAIHYEEILQT